MLLRYGLKEEKAAKRLEDAVFDVLDRGFRTRDIHTTGTVSHHIKYVYINKLHVTIYNFDKQIVSFWNRFWWVAREWVRRY